MRPVVLIYLVGVALALVPPVHGQPTPRRGVRTKVQFVISDNGYKYTLGDPDDRDRLRELYHQRTLEFANRFVRSLKGGGFRPELDRIAQVGSGGQSQDQFYNFLEGLQEVPASAITDGALSAAGQKALKRVQLAWSLVQLVRFGAPGYRATNDAGGEAGGFDEFLQEAQLDKSFLNRMKEFEDRYESFVEVAKEGDVPQAGTYTRDQLIDGIFANLQAIFTSKADLAPGTAPPPGLLRDFAVSVVEQYLTDPGAVWRIQPQWYDLADASPEVRARTTANFMSSGFQILAWSLPRMDLNDPDASLEELGKGYNIQFSFDGWVKPGGPGSNFPTAWGMSGNGLTNSVAESAFVTGTGSDVSIFETLTVDAEPVPMTLIDQSLVRSGVEPSPDEISIEELVRAFYKELEAFDQPPVNLGSVGTSLTAPGNPPSTQPTGRFSGGSGGGSFP